MKKRVYLLIGIIVLFLCFVWIYVHRYIAHNVSQHSSYDIGQVMVVSVSSDGSYAVSTGLKRRTVLWDLQNHTKKILDKTANIYSAYFIKNTNNFMWQHDTDNEVIIENIDGKVIKRFNPGFPSYGEAITKDLKTYFGSNEKWDIYKIDFHKDVFKKMIMKKGLFAPDFIGAGKTFNFSFSPYGKYLLSCGFAGDESPLSAGQGSLGDKPGSRSLLAGIVLWDVESGKPIQKYFGNVGKTYATLSPDGKYVVAGDEDGGAYLWNTKNSKVRMDMHSIFGIAVKDKNGFYHWDNTGFLPVPEAFRGHNPLIFSLKFIDQNHYLRFTTYFPKYAILYSITDPKPLKYLRFGNDPKISVYEYVRDQSIDTSPKAHILVTGKVNQGGILVYKYDPKTQTLTKIWDAK